MTFEDTIAAISTAPGTGAIAIVRLSGPEAFLIISRIFTPYSAVDLESTSQSSMACTAAGSSNKAQIIEGLQSHVARHGYIKDPQSHCLIDEVMIVPYKGPKTYTGEDLVEINCHGGSVITSEILTLCLVQGARLSKQGEFTKRAFLSGRIDLTQAEAVLDLIQAKTLGQGKAALSVLSGQLGQKIKSIREKLMHLLTTIVAGIDFPEEIGDAPIAEIESTILTSLHSLQQLNKTARSGRFLREGLRIAIVGRPNAGKSSLLNQLLKYERAIVTDIPGTTRDSLEELLDLNGIPIVVIDTAGIRPTEDQVERMGIERSRRAIETADLILLVMDLTASWGAPEMEILAAVNNRPYLIVANKIDAFAHEQNIDGVPISQSEVGRAFISARNGNGIEHLTSIIENWVYKDGAAQAGQVSLNARQAELCLRATQALELALETVNSNLPQDCIATDLKIAIDNLSEICGEAVSDEIIHQVFANFCIGK